ncbi:hypothetical protein Dimus_013783 [Dionaea muscipula]
MFHYKKKEFARSRVREVEIEFDSMRLASILGVTLVFVRSGENRRRDDEEAAPAENEEMNEEERVQPDFDWEAVVDEDALQGESGLGENFYDAEDEVQGSAAVVEEVQEVPTPTSIQRKEIEASGVDPSAPTGSILDSVFMTLQPELERARADRIKVDLEKAKAENARLLTLLQQAQSQHNP